MTVGVLVSRIINASTVRDGYYMDKNPNALVPMMMLFKWVSSGQKD